ncbi:MAG: hypothetical protein WAM70_16640 [Pyrinomonadaceae bacterium]
MNELIRLAELKTREYREKFKDLSAEEEQEIVEYDIAGVVIRRRRIVSDLIIYQSQLDTSKMSEYRNVRSVDGVAVTKRDERLVDLFGQLAKADAVKKELERINRESARYDLRFRSNGFTLNEGMLLAENLRSAFKFTAAGREQINGRDVIVVQYQQIAPSLGISYKLNSLPKQLKGAETRYRGRLWLDAETAQLWREEQENTIEHPSLRQPLVFARFELEYANSKFGILTPQRIVFNAFTHAQRKVDNTHELRLGGKVTSRYSGFTRFDVSSPDASIDLPTKP